MYDARGFRVHRLAHGMGGGTYKSAKLPVLSADLEMLLRRCCDALLVVEVHCGGSGRARAPVQSDRLTSPRGL